MDRRLSREALLAEFEPIPGPTRAARLMRLFNAGDDHVYLREIARLAKTHGARLMFVFLPTYDGSTRIADRVFLEQFGEVVNFGDLSKDNTLYMNIGHLNHAGAMIASDRLADVIVASAF